MSTIAQKLADLAQIKSDIASAIVAQGVSVDPSDTFASYAIKIGQISGSSGERDSSSSSWTITAEVNT